MFWIRHPRTVGLLVSLPAIPAVILTVLWVLEPSDSALEPVAVPAVGLVEGQNHVRRLLDLGPADDAAELRRVAAARPPVAGLDRDREPLRRIGIYRDGEQVGWVAASRSMLAQVAADHLDAMAAEADAAREASLVERERFAEAHEMSLANAEARASGGQRVVRGPSDLVRLFGSGSVMDGARFQRLDFVEAMARDRAQIRRASEQRSRASSRSSRSGSSRR